MKPPIIVDDHGDVSVFDSVEKAERYLEPMDAKNRPNRCLRQRGTLARGASD